MTLLNKITPALICLSLIAPHRAGANTAVESFLPGNDLSVSAFMGKTTPRGFYEDYLAGCTSFGLGLIYPLPFSQRFYLAEAEFLASEHALRGSESSNLSLYALRAGAMAHYPWTRYFQPYGGLYLQESFIVLEAGKIGERETTWKTGLAFKAGFFSTVYRDFGIRAGMEYAAMDLSGERLETYSFTAAAVVHVPLSRMFMPDEKSDPGRQADSAKIRAEAVYLRGLGEIEKGNLEAAESSFREVLQLKAGHPDASKQIAGIAAARESYTEAKALAGQKKFYEAIPYLEKSRGYIRDAERDLAGTRAMLSGELPELERRGIVLYENREYDQCITIMRKILAIDPENQTGKLYLPRAQSRKQAIERLK